MREADLALDDEAAAELAAFVHLSEAGSTQDEAFARPLPGRGALVVVADRQSAGRGRRGRGWQGDPEGALALTVLRRFEQPPRALAALGPAVGVAVARALRAQGAAVTLKWPNDLVFEDRKLGGILIEARGPAVAIGLGLNLSLSALPGVDQPWTDLARAGLAAPARVAVLGAVLRSLLPALLQFEREGFAVFAEAWKEFDALAGRAVRVLAGDAVHEGVVLGLAEDGGLRVQQADGERLHHAGEVSVRVAA